VERLQNMLDGDGMTNAKALKGLHTITIVDNNPYRLCSVYGGHVRNSCVFKSSCDAVSGASYHLGYASYDKVTPQEKTTGELLQYVVKEGTCLDGYRIVGGKKPQMTCEVVYENVNGTKTLSYSRWTQQKNACEKIPEDEKEK